MRRIGWLALLAATSGPALAQTVSISAPPTIGNVGNVTAAVSGTTEFRVSTTGVVTVVPGGGGSRQSTGNVSNTISLTCTGGTGGGKGPCNSNNVIVRVAPNATQTGRAQPLNGLQIAMGSAVLAANGAPTYNGETVTFTIQPIGRDVTRTFRLGFDLPISGGFGPSGAASSGLTVQAGFAPNFTAVVSGAATATTRNGTDIAKLSDLTFGAILPLEGQTGTVSINAISGNRQSSNPAGVLLRPGITASRGLYSVTSEGGQMISVSVPTSFTMTGPGTPINVTLTSTADPGLVVGGDAGGIITASGSPGSSGTTELGIGGSFTVTGPMTPGAYSGTFSVVFAWN